MTHPAWPSNVGRSTLDYDTHAAYYGAKKAAEPVHVQLNLPGNELVVLNTTRGDRKGLSVETRVVGLDGAPLFARTDRLDALANRATDLPDVPLAPILNARGMALVELTLRKLSGAELDRNFYWRGKDEVTYPEPSIAWSRLHFDFPRLRPFGTATTWSYARRSPILALDRRWRRS